MAASDLALLKRPLAGATEHLNHLQTACVDTMYVNRQYHFHPTLGKGRIRDPVSSMSKAMWDLVHPKIGATSQQYIQKTVMQLSFAQKAILAFVTFTQKSTSKTRHVTNALHALRTCHAYLDKNDRFKIQ